jgi:tetratricopeptide (TPR) repeat protein
MRRLVFLFLLMAGPALADARADARRAELDRLLGALKAAPNETAAGMLETRIRHLWLEQGSPASTLLMGRGMRDLEADAGQEAEDDFDAVLALDPDLTEAFVARAMARFAQADYMGAVHDIEETLKREPRHFGAWQQLSRIAEARGDWKGALAAWQKVLEIDPKMPDGQERLRILTRKAVGEST